MAKGDREPASGFLAKLFGLFRGEGRVRRPGYHRLVTWVERNTPAKFDGSQPPEVVKEHLEVKLAELKRKGWSERRLAGFRWFVESQAYDQLLST